MAIQKETVVRRLTELRERHADPQTGKPLPQEKAAARVGVTMRQWQRWESGGSLPYPRNLEAIADAFQFPVADFFDEPQPDAATSLSEGGVTARLDQMQAELEAARADRQDLAAQIAKQNANLAKQSQILERLEQLVLVLTGQDEAAGHPLRTVAEVAQVLADARRPDQTDQQGAETPATDDPADSQAS
ncbi:MAG TPA: helix-turn-helix domain-containing protein [Solirubrobacteraceae bacterium]|nr:helix-turn-helix domain-containing protein [Solirubrobacteraceae bacterium]